MLYAYYGDDEKTARAKVRATVTQLLKKNPEATHFRITADMLDSVDFVELTQSQSLFKREYIVVLDHILDHAKGEALLVEHLEALAEAPHPFFLLETALRAPLKKKIERHATRVQAFTQGKSVERSAFNIFALTDALGEGDTMKLWALFRKAKQHGARDEEVHGLLFWMLKSMALAAQSATPEEAGMKPYPFQKAKRYASRFSDSAALHARITELALLPTSARRRGIPLEIALERFILSQ